MAPDFTTGRGGMPRAHPPPATSCSTQREIGHMARKWRAQKSTNSDVSTIRPGDRFERRRRDPRGGGIPRGRFGCAGRRSHRRDGASAWRRRPRSRRERISATTFDKRLCRIVGSRAQRQRNPLEPCQNQSSYALESRDFGRSRVHRGSKVTSGEISRQAMPRAQSTGQRRA